MLCRRINQGQSISNAVCTSVRLVFLRRPRSTRLKHGCHMKLRLLMVTATLAAFAAGDGSAAAESQDTTGALQEVTVTAQRLNLNWGQRNALVQQVASFVYGITQLENEEGLARWNTPICPFEKGLAKERGQFVIERFAQLVHRRAPRWGTSDAIRICSFSCRYRAGPAAAHGATSLRSLVWQFDPVPGRPVHRRAWSGVGVAQCLGAQYRKHAFHWRSAARLPGSRRGFDFGTDIQLPRCDGCKSSARRRVEL